MSSSDSEEDEDLAKLKAAIAPEFSLAKSTKNATPNGADGTPVADKPADKRSSKLNDDRVDKLVDDEKKTSLRPDKQKQVNSADALDLDGFTPQFKDHLAKKLGSKLEKELSAVIDEEEGETNGYRGTEEESEEEEEAEEEEEEGEEEEEDDDEEEEAISVFSSSKRDRVVDAPPDAGKRKKRKKSLAEDLKRIHYAKKMKALKALNGKEGGDDDVNAGVGRDDVGTNDFAGNDGAGSSGDEDERKLLSVAVSGESLLSASQIVRTVSSTANSVAKKKKKKKKKKKSCDDGETDQEESSKGDAAETIPGKPTETADGDAALAPQDDAPTPQDPAPTPQEPPKRNKRKKKGKQERMKARTRLEEEKLHCRPETADAD